jgi:hypothetical protein
LPPAALGGSAIEVVRAAGLVALAERTSEPPRAEPDALRRHDLTVRALADRLSAILPARFGQTTAGTAELEALLSDHRDRFVRGLDRVRGCVQVTTRLVADDDSERVAADEPAHGGGDGTAIAGVENGPGRRWLRRRLAERRSPALDALCRSLEPIARETRTRLGPAAATASAYHLVERERARELIDLAAAFQPPAGMRVTVSGPFPPYAFVEELP